MRDVKSAVASASFFDASSNVQLQAIQGTTASGSSWPRPVHSKPAGASISGGRCGALRVARFPH